MTLSNQTTQGENRKSSKQANNQPTTWEEEEENKETYIHTHIKRKQAMWSSLFGKSTSTKKNKELPKKAIVDLREHINLLTKRQSHLQTQILNQENEAKQFLHRGNKTLAKNALKKKKIYEAQLSKLDGTIESLEQQLFSIESASLNLETMRAMKQGATAMKAIHGSLNIDKVDATMDEIREQVELGEEISEAISKPMFVTGTEIDEDELDEELDLLAAEEEEGERESGVKNVEIPAAAAVLPSAPSGKLKATKQLEVPAEEADDEDEDARALKELQAEIDS